MTDRTFPSKRTALSAAIASALFSATAVGQITVPCAGSSALTCTVSGPYSEEVFVNPQGNNSPVPPMTVNATSDITVSVQAATTAALKVLSTGQQGSSNGSLTGGDTQGLTVTNSGNLTLQGNAITVSGDFYGLYAQMMGGNGVSTSNGDDGGNGGVAGRSLDQILSLTNTGSINMNLTNVNVPSGAILGALSSGGVGGETTDGSGGAGGQSVGVNVTNSGNLSATLAGTNRYAGIQAVSNGGHGGFDSKGNDLDGGGAGAVSVTNSGAITLNWNWNSGSAGSEAALYGVLAQAQSGEGGNASLGDNGGNAGQGYAALMSGAITLKAGSTIRVTQTGTPPVGGAGAAVRLIGGAGGDATSNNDDVLGGNGGDAGQILSGTPIASASARILNTDANVIVSGEKLSGLMIATVGGAGGGNFSTESYHDRHGGRGGIAGDGSITVNASTQAITLSTVGDTAPAVAALLQGGNGADGGLYNGDIAGIGFSNAGNGGSGGAAGQINIALNGQSQLPITVATTGGNSPGIYALTTGGLGGNGGALSGTLGGGAGGTAGASTLR